jgi:hypothetical protein
MRPYQENGTFNGLRVPLESDPSFDLGKRAKECFAIPARVIATCFALAAFVAAILLGMSAGNVPETILTRAIVVMVVAWPIGRFCGAVAQWAIQSHIDSYKKAHPIPADSSSAGAEISTVPGAGDGKGSSQAIATAPTTT